MAVLPKQPQNIWIAAADGDLQRVKKIIASLYSPEYARNTDNQKLHIAVSPNSYDEFTYTPMHAAASYGQIEVLEYLVSCGGDINISDNDGDTPLYTVENTATAQFLVEHGAVIDRRNNEGISPIEHLSEEFPEVANYLQSLSASTSQSPSSSLHLQNPSQPSQHVQNTASEQLTSALMATVQDIMERAEAEGRDPDEELRQAVGRTVLEGMITGFAMSTEEDTSDGRGHDQNGIDSPAKRSRTNDGPR